MDKDRVKGAINDAAGRLKRQVGEWTGDTDSQVEGAVQQVKGKAQKAWGNVKDAARDASEHVNRDRRTGQTGMERESKMEREREVREKEQEHAHSGHNR